MTRHVSLLKRLAVLESALAAEKPLRVTGGLPPDLQPAIPFIRIGPRALRGDLPNLPDTSSIYTVQISGVLA